MAFKLGPTGHILMCKDWFITSASHTSCNSGFPLCFPSAVINLLPYDCARLAILQPVVTAGKSSGCAPAPAAMQVFCVPASDQLQCQSAGSTVTLPTAADSVIRRISNLLPMCAPCVNQPALFGIVLRMAVSGQQLSKAAQCNTCPGPTL